MKTYLRILRYARPYKSKIVYYTIFILFSVVFSTLALYMLWPVLDMLFYPEKQAAALNTIPVFKLSSGSAFVRQWVQFHAADLSVHNSKSLALLYVTAFVVLFNLLGNVFKFLSSRFLGTIRTRVVEDIRKSVFDKLIYHEISYLENQRKGDIVSRVTSDVTEVENSVVITFESIIRDPLAIIWALGMMISLSWQLTIFIFLILPVSSIVISKISKTLKRNATDTMDYYGRIMSIVDETISGMRIIKAFNAEGYIRKIFNGFNERYSRLSRIHWHKKALVPIFSESAMVAVVGLTLWFGGNRVYAGQLSASAFISYLTMFYLLIAPLKSLSSAFGNIYKGLASGERIFALSDAPVIIKDRADSKEINEFHQRLSIQNLSFTYVNEPVLKDINLEIEKGKTYALVGPSGSGKSTLAELLLRFYDPGAGGIFLDGIDLRDIKLESLRKLTAVVTQEPILFNDTIYNNIAFGLPDVTREQVESAAKAANAHDFILETEKGYDTNIGDRGGLLSGGQRQRLSIARAILKNPAILILDEATSALDTSSEKIVQDALYHLMEHRTSIVIAHRLSTIQDADEIIVIEKGRIAERGTHLELINLNGIYTRLSQLQQLDAN
jgi:ATP-binding cassette, subfamily B, bacterial MsbA